MKPHRHTSGHEHDFEPVRGLPEELPAGEHILWQGAPDWRALALRAFHLRKLALYFAGLLALKAALVLHGGGSAAAAAQAVGWLLPLAALGLGLVALLAWLSARTTVYTLTERRLVMRIGIVLTMAFNLPLRRIERADLRAAPRGAADIALTLVGSDRFAWLQLWPHARPWVLSKPQPMLRCVPDGARIGELIARTWSAAQGQAPAERPASPPAAAGETRLPARPALATR